MVMVFKKRPSKEKIINICLNALIALFSIVLLISIYIGVQIRILDHDYANFFGYSMFEVQSESMEETISVGDWIIIKLNSKIQLKDIITFKVEDDYITHRVVEIHQGTYITKGDNNNGKDDPVDETAVVGKVVKTLHGGAGADPPHRPPAGNPAGQHHVHRGAADHPGGGGR